MCKQLQVLHFNLHMPLEVFVFCGALLQMWLYKAFVAQNVMLKLVYLNKLVTLHISGLHYVKETYLFLLSLYGCGFCLLCFKH
jgi:hypothetical protein